MEIKIQPQLYAVVQIEGETCLCSALMMGIFKFIFADQENIDNLEIICFIHADKIKYMPFSIHESTIELYDKFVEEPHNFFLAAVFNKYLAPGMMHKKSHEARESEVDSYFLRLALKRLMISLLDEGEPIIRLITMLEHIITSILEKSSTYHLASYIGEEVSHIVSIVQTEEEIRNWQPPVPQVRQNTEVPFISDDDFDLSVWGDVFDIENNDESEGE